MIATVSIRITRVTSTMRLFAVSAGSARRTLNNQSRASRAELFAYSKNFARSGPLVLPYPSAMFALIDPTASSS
jgi:hypothetical protein